MDIKWIFMDIKWILMVDICSKVNGMLIPTAYAESSRMPILRDDSWA